MLWGITRRTLQRLPQGTPWEIHWGVPWGMHRGMPRGILFYYSQKRVFSKSN